MRLNLGCGSITPSSWQNVDYALGARIARWPIIGPLARGLGVFSLRWDPKIYIHDLTTPFPWRERSVDAIYSSHTLEHFDREAGRRFLAECRRVLRPGGVIRIVVPDLAAHIRRYARGELPAENFLEDIDVLTGVGLTGLKRKLAPFVQYPHKCMYDEVALLRVMRDVGFECAPRRPFESDIADIGELELDSRTVDAVIVEGRRPGD